MNAQEQDRGGGEAFAFESAPDSDVYLLTGAIMGPDGGQVMAVGYAIAPSAREAAEAQLLSAPHLRLTGVVSLAELKEQTRLLESARMGALPALAVGVYAEALARQTGAKL